MHSLTIAPRTVSTVVAPQAATAVALPDFSTYTLVQINAWAKANGIKIPSAVSKKADRIQYITTYQARSVATAAAGPVVLPDFSTYTRPQINDWAKANGIKIPSSITKKADRIQYLVGACSERAAGYTNQGK